MWAIRNKSQLLMLGLVRVQNRGVRSRLGIAYFRVRYPWFYCVMVFPDTLEYVLTSRITEELPTPLSGNIKEQPDVLSVPCMHVFCSVKPCM